MPPVSGGYVPGVADGRELRKKGLLAVVVVVVVVERIVSRAVRVYMRRWISSGYQSLAAVVRLSAKDRLTPGGGPILGLICRRWRPSAAGSLPVSCALVRIIISFSGSAGDGQGDASLDGDISRGQEAPARERVR